MSSIDQQFVEFIVKSLVSKPDAVSVERRIDEKGVLLELTVDPEDLGRVIGKRGATAQSLRTLLRALGTKNDARYNLKIVDNGEPGAGRAQSSQPTQSSGDVGSSSDASASSDSAAPDDSALDHTVQDSADQPMMPAKSSDDDDLSDLDDDKVEPKKSEEEPGSMVSKTRKELEELDDLDV